MRRATAGARGFLIALVVTTAGLLGAVVFLPGGARAATLYVGGTGPGNYTAIQAAVDAAVPGDTVFVYRGTYPEQVTITKTLTLVGEDREGTVIDSRGIGDAVFVGATSWVNISGFTVTTSIWGASGDGIALSSVQHSRIRDVNASHNTDSGIYLYFSSNNVIENNTLRDNMDPLGAGVFLRFSDYNWIANNTATDNADGTALESSGHNVIVGNNASTNWDYGVHLSSGSNWNRVEDNSWFDNWGRGLRARDSDWNTIWHNRLVQNYEGIQLFESSNNTVADNLVLNTGDGISSDYGTHNRITNNTVSGYMWTGIGARGSSSEMIDNNTIGGSSWADIELSGSTAIAVIDNTMDGRGVLVTSGSVTRGFVSNWNTHEIPTSNLVNGRPVIYWKNVTGGVAPLDAGQVILGNCTGVTVADLSRDRVVAVVQTGFSSGNTIVNVSGRDGVLGVYLAASSSTTVRNASFVNASQAGTYLTFSDGNSIENGMYAGSGYVGLYVSQSAGNTIVAVNVTGATSAGMSLYYAAGNLVSGGTLSANLGSGISLYASDNNSFALSRLENNTWDGFTLRNANNNLFTGNLIARNGKRGVNVTNSLGNRAYHNDLVGNGQQAFDDRANGWDDGYPSGGNFWSDYAGSDAFQGPNQDIPGSDGIGDTPYGIDADSADRYPLMAPYILRDPVPPTVAIGYPAEGEILTVTPVTVTGTASDAGGSGLYRIEVRANGGPWRVASGTSVWSAVVDLVSGPNVIEARARDYAANPSPVAAVNVTYTPPNTPPVAAFTVNPASGSVATPFVVDASGSADAEDSTSVLEVRWDWEGDGTWDTTWSTAKSTQHGYPSAGAYSMRLEVRDTGGLTDQATRTVWANNTSPIASFTVAPASGDVTTDFAVDASASSDLEDPPTLLEVRWDWENDGTWDTPYVTTKTAQHRFASPGVYTMRLEVRDLDGLAGQTTRTVWVNNTAPIASFTLSTAVGNVTTDFVGDASACSDLEDPASILEVRWDWEDDGTWDTAWSTGKVAQHRYPTTGVRTIRLQVRDSGGLTDESTGVVSVENTAPTASFTVSPGSGSVTTAFTLNASGSSDLEDPPGDLEFRWDWEDDGTWDSAWSPANVAQHSYSAPGPYTVRLEARDRGGLSDQATASVVVDNTAPIAAFTVTPPGGDVTTAFAVDASGSSDLEDPDSVLLVRWDWEDDGSWDTVWTGSMSASHTYANPGTYAIRLAVRDTAGLVGEVTGQVSVANTPPSAALAVEFMEGDVGAPFRFNASGSTDLEDGPGTLEFRWDWESDGTWDAGWSTNGTADHAYLVAGVYSVRVEVRDSGGLTDTASIEVTVRAIPDAPGFPFWILPAVLVPIAILLAAAVLRRRAKHRAATPPEEPEESGEAREGGTRL